MDVSAILVDIIHFLIPSGATSNTCNNCNKNNVTTRNTCIHVHVDTCIHRYKRTVKCSTNA